jgi:probable O-glycosylation ligase (exosortase A-associated)
MISLPFNMEKKEFYLDKLSILILLFTISATISWLTALVPGADTDALYQKLVKEVVLFFAITSVMITRHRIHLVLVIITLSIGFFSVKEGLIFALTAGGHKITGSGAIGDNNALATAMLMTVPILYYLYRYSALKPVRLGFLAALVLSVIATIGTYSRGGSIGMLIVGLFMVKNSRHKISTAAFFILVAAFVYSLAPADWFDRLSTINSATDDGSFMGRVVAWKMSVLVALDNPLTGGGPHSIHRLLVWDTYRPLLPRLDFVTTPPADTLPHAAHSIWFEILGDLGLPGMLLFLGILALAFWECRKIVRMARGQPSLVWAADLARMLQISLVVYVTTGSALSLGYFEMYYIILALLSRISRTVQQTLIEQARLANAETLTRAFPARAPHSVFARSHGATA